MPLVSVVTPSFNQGAYIGQTIRSVGEQDYPNVEHIIVDGGSTDGTLDVIRAHEDAYGLRWISEPDGGMYEAVNKGLRLARGEFLAYLNSDDRYLPWTLSTVARELQDHPEAGFVFGDIFRVDEGTDSGEMYFYPPFRLGFVRRLGFLGQPAVFWRRGVMDEFGPFDESLKFVADCDYWMRIGGRYGARKIQEVLAIDRNHPEAKREAQTDALYRELREVRSRYVPMEGAAYQIPLLLDRAHGAFWRRYLMLRFLLTYLRRPGAKGGAPYAAFVTRGGKVRVAVGTAVATLLPLTWKRVARGMIRKDLDSYGGNG